MSTLGTFQPLREGKISDTHAPSVPRDGSLPNRSTALLVVQPAQERWQEAHCDKTIISCCNAGRWYRLPLTCICAAESCCACQTQTLSLLDSLREAKDKSPTSGIGHSTVTAARGSLPQPAPSSGCGQNSVEDESCSNVESRFYLPTAIMLPEKSTSNFMNQMSQSGTS